MIKFTKDQEKKIWSWLIDGVEAKPAFGPVTAWTTNHWQHLHVYLCLLFDQQISSLAAEFSEKAEDIEKAVLKVPKTDDSEPLVLIAEVINSDISKKNKIKIVENTIEYTLKQVNNTIESVDELFTNINKVSTKPVGRQKLNREALFKWLDYLTQELGSINKAASYAANYPLRKFMSEDNLKREYRKWRKGGAN